MTIGNKSLLFHNLGEWSSSNFGRPALTISRTGRSRKGRHRRKSAIVWRWLNLRIGIGVLNSWWNEMVIQFDFYINEKANIQELTDHAIQKTFLHQFREAHKMALTGNYTGLFIMMKEATINEIINCGAKVPITRRSKRFEKIWELH